MTLLKFSVILFIIKIIPLFFISFLTIFIDVDFSVIVIGFISSFSWSKKVTFICFIWCLYILENKSYVFCLKGFFLYNIKDYIARYPAQPIYYSNYLPCFVSSFKLTGWFTKLLIFFLSDSKKK